MSYSHRFYSVDLSSLQAIYGSHDHELLAEIRTKQRRELEVVDDEASEYKNCPNSETMLREIFAGKIGRRQDADASFASGIRTGW